MKTALFWVITLRVVVIPYRRFETTYRFQLQGSRIQKDYCNGCFIKLNLLLTKPYSIMLILTDVIPLHEFANNSKTEGVDVFSVSTEAHLALPKAHCVLSC